MEENVLKCSGDCLKCKQVQWQYCASQFTLNTYRIVENLQGMVKSLGETVADLKAQMDRVEDSKSKVFNPSDTERIERIYG